MSHEYTKYAFPGVARDQYGLHMRDWFAGMAMNTALTVAATRQAPPTPQSIAIYAYELADAMMLARCERWPR